MTEKEVKLKLFKDEVVHCETFLLAAKCGELVDSLGECWDDNKSYISDSSYEFYRKETCYNYNQGKCSSKEVYEIGGHKIISATEFLNRHGIFVEGQEVYCSDDSVDDAESMGLRTYLANNFTICPSVNKEAYHWKYIVSPYPTFEELIKERDPILIEIGGKCYNAKEVEERLSTLKPV